MIRRIKYEKCTNRPPIVLKAKYRSGSLEFDTLKDKKQFLLDRELQRVQSGLKPGHSSRVGQRIDHMVEKENTETHMKYHVFEHSKCDDCGNDVIRYDKRGFKVCEKCGLVAGGVTFSHEFYPPPDSRTEHDL